MIDNIVRKNVKPSDYSAVIKERSGHKIPDGAGDYYDHITEMQQSVCGLKKAARGLEGSLKNPKLNENTRQFLEQKLRIAIETIQRMQNALGKK